MTVVAWILIGIAVLLTAYTYIGYPALLFFLARRRSWRATPSQLQSEWPSVSIAVPAYNEEAQIRGVLDSLLRIDYPREKVQILVMSDASTDHTDEIVAEYADRGVELLRMPRRKGKTAAENAAGALLRGEIVVNTDASIRIRPDALKPLIASFTDPAVGVASGRDVSVGPHGEEANAGEARYVGMEMAIRALETRLGGIIGASGCFYAIRAHLNRTHLPDHLARDFAAAMIARLHGFRAVSVDEAVCLVPRTGSLPREYKRKVRTVCGGLETLWYMRRLLNPFRYGLFSWMLVSHKLCRWLIPWTAVLALSGLALIAVSEPWAGVLLAGAALAGVLAVIGWRWPTERPMPALLAFPAFLLLAGNLSVLHAWVRAFLGKHNTTWEPTRREAVVVR
jgi:cellulose synthase/poly-beta-1,6-N-acetylglucosamine synthase-like glycosyltransferase